MGGWAKIKRTAVQTRETKEERKERGKRREKGGEESVQRDRDRDRVDREGVGRVGKSETMSEQPNWSRRGFQDVSLQSLWSPDDGDVRKEAVAMG